jgi:uncharacterized protein
MTGRNDTEWRVWHGAVMLVLVYAGTSFLWVWPFPMLVPLLVYAMLLAVWPGWRSTCVWAKWGFVSRDSVAVAAALGALAAAVLVYFHYYMQPDISPLRLRLVVDRWPHPLVWAACFSLLNAAMEEAIFRGALLDALDVRLGKAGALLISSALFGMAHMEGYPPGALGVVLSGIFGAVLAGMRIWTKGLLLPIAVHICADAAIAWVVLAR